MKEPIRIAYCIPALYYPSGMERVLTMKANYLAEHGYEVHIILTDGGNKPSYYPLDSSVRLHQLDIDFEKPYYYSICRRVWMYQRRMYSLKKRLNNCLCSIRPDITISLLRRDINVLHQMKDGSIKMGEIHFDRLHYRNVQFRWLPQIVNRWLTDYWMNSLIRKLHKLSTFVVLTHEDATYWPELDNVVVIHNPLTVQPQPVHSYSSHQIIAAGRYVDQKGFDRLIEAWRLLAADFPDWKLRIYGDGHLREALQKQVDELGLTNSCILEHSVPDITSRYADSSMFVLSSRFEGFGLVIVEAMSCGLPVVSFACPCGPKDIITEGQDGFLVEEGNVEAMAQRMRQLIQDEKLRSVMGVRAMHRAEDFDMKKIGLQWINLFERLISQYGRNQYVVR